MGICELESSYFRLLLSNTRTQNIVLLRSLLEAQLMHLDVVCDQIRANIVERTSVHVAMG